MPSSLMLRRGALPVALVASGLLVGCGARTQAEPVSLASLSGRTLGFALVDADTVERLPVPGAHRFTVTFSLPEVGCTSLAPGVSATFNGQPMVLEPGGLSEVGRETCAPTRAFLDFDPALWAQEPAEDARILLQDAEHTLTLVVRGAKAKRRFVFQGAGSPEALRRGQTYSWLWVPDEETPGAATATLQRVGGSAFATLALTQQGGLVGLRMPEATPLAEHLLRLSATAPGEVLACEGVASCEGSLFHSEEFAIAVTN